MNITYETLRKQRTIHNNSTKLYIHTHTHTRRKKERKRKMDVRSGDEYKYSGIYIYALSRIRHPINLLLANRLANCERMLAREQIKEPPFIKPAIK